MEKGKVYYYVWFEYEKEADGFGLTTRHITDKGSVGIHPSVHAFEVSGQLDALEAAIGFYVKEFTKDIKKAEKGGNNTHTSSLIITVEATKTDSHAKVACVYTNNLFYKFGRLDRQYYQANGNEQLEMHSDDEGRKPTIQSVADIKADIMGSIRAYEKAGEKE